MDHGANFYKFVWLGRFAPAGFMYSSNPGAELTAGIEYSLENVKCCDGAIVSGHSPCPEPPKPLQTAQGSAYNVNSAQNLSNVTNSTNTSTSSTSNTIMPLSGRATFMSPSGQLVVGVRQEAINVPPAPPGYYWSMVEKPGVAGGNIFRNLPESCFITQSPTPTPTPTNPDGSCPPGKEKVGDSCCKMITVRAELRDPPYCTICEHFIYSAALLCNPNIDNNNVNNPPVDGGGGGYPLIGVVDVGDSVNWQDGGGGPVINPVVDQPLPFNNPVNNGNNPDIEGQQDGNDQGPDPDSYPLSKSGSSYAKLVDNGIQNLIAQGCLPPYQPLENFPAIVESGSNAINAIASVSENGKVAQYSLTMNCVVTVSNNPDNILEPDLTPTNTNTNNSDQYPIFICGLPIPPYVYDPDNTSVNNNLNNLFNAPMCSPGFPLPPQVNPNPPMCTGMPITV